FPGADADSLLFLLDERGVDSAAGSACSSGVTQASPVLAAMGIPDGQARGALRLSLGWTSTERDVEILLAALPESLERARAVGALLTPGAPPGRGASHVREDCPSSRTSVHSTVRNLWIRKEGGEA